MVDLPQIDEVILAGTEKARKKANRGVLCQKAAESIVEQVD